MAAAIPGFEDDELLRPQSLYERQGRLAEYAEIVEKLTAERRAYLRAFSGLAEEIVVAI